MAFENLKKSGIAYVLEKLKSVFLQIADAVRSVNGNEPDENGDITLTVVPYAQNLQSESSQRNVDVFIDRTAGGTTSIEDGDAWLMTIKGNSVHEDYVAEELDCQAYPVDPDSPTAISVEIDRDTFVQEVSESGTITLLYANDWSTDPTVYGVTVTGTPANGDSIVITYVAEERGTITVANPHSLITTGWNLYNNDAEYARALKYSEDYSFRISGTYTALKFSTTLDGTKADIVVTDGAFDVPADGYIWVTGGNSTDTAIWMAWSDWGEGYVGDFTTYVEHEIDLTSVMSTYFPYGLCKAGSVRDEIDLNIGQAISRVEVLAYSEANRAAAAASGREYEFDEDYIYLARSAAVINSISVDGSATVDDHGLEIFTYTDVPVFAQILYGNNLKNKLERDVLQISQQTLTAEQQEQVRQNIGIVYSATEPSNPVTGMIWLKPGS